MTVIELRDRLNQIIDAGEGALPVCSNTYDGWLGEVTADSVLVQSDSLGKSREQIRMLLIGA